MTRQRASARRRRTPSPLHGASRSTRSNDCALSGRRATVGDDRVQCAEAQAPCHVRDEPEPAGVHVDARPRHRRRRPAPRAPPPCHPARRRDRRRVRPAAGRPRPPPPGSPGPAAWRAPHVRRRAGRGHRCPARSARRAPSAPRADVHGDAMRNSASSASAVTRRGFGRSVTAAGSFIAASAPRRRVGAEIGFEPRDEPVGIRQRDRTVGGLGPRRPEPADARGARRS